MNIFVGSMANKKTNSVVAKQFSTYAKDRFNKKTQKLDSKVSELSYFDDGGVLVGTASKNGISIFLYGFVYKPLPGWTGKTNPVDDPNKTASFLLDRYIKHGNDFLNDVYGHFAVVLQNSKTQETLLARDPDGQNDLFVSEGEHGVQFSNKLRCLAECAPTPIEIDRKYEDFLLVYGFYPDATNVYKGTRLIPNKKITRLHPNEKLAEIEIKYAPTKKKATAKSEKALVDQLHDTLIQATKDILPTNTKKVAVLLGGFDSALVASILHRLGYEVETFSFYYEDGRYNQPHTDTLAEYLGIKHNWIKIDAKVIEDGLKNFSHLFNQPTNWLSYVIQTAHLANVIRERGFTYCYSGDGCDSLFYGFPLTYKRAELMSVIGSVPNPLLTAAIKVAERPSLERAIGRPYQVGLGALRSGRRSKDVRTFLTFRIFDELSIKQLRNNNTPKQHEDPEDTIKRLVAAHSGVSSTRLAYEGKNRVAPSRNKINGSADSSGIVIMSPYTHQIVKDFVKSIPDNLLRPKNADTAIGKYILSKMAEKKELLTKDVIYQAKMAASDSPMQAWLDDELQGVIYSNLKGLPFDYNKKYVKSLINETKAEKLYAKTISKQTSNVVTVTHCIGLLSTYADFTNVKQKNGTKRKK